ncbi:conserved hypothetical protein [Chthoniobacter flavus Ellin428]|uniref:Secreted protein n=1 Tax=Chthoniobacter flavus Ellin428 TaxID=497964 RepID=B4DBA1_9BACT|nr:hypothetical protein [Chthoniobacter flavus]EDY16289.1 conserved hypothetical protein [Chthoniobacter flavus Ellin428]TCO84715.1 hypothetical protein EV701_13420 [Chthoniobacter flavus]
MSRSRFFFAFIVLCLLAVNARAHIGSPDVFFDGKIGPYPAKVTIRVPPVVPGRAEIDVRPVSNRPLQVSILPLFSKTSLKNSPPPEPALPAPEEAGLYRGDLWLMRSGGYSVEVKIHGDAGDGVVQIPVNSVATHQLPLPRYLAVALIGLAGLLVIGGLAIVRAAAGESTLPPDTALDSSHRRKGLIAATFTAFLCLGSLAGGRYWWNVEEASFRKHLREGAWPDLAAEVHTAGGQRILHLTVGETTFGPHYTIPLLTDHGKLLHLFLIGKDGNSSVAHLHPIRQGGKVFEVALPPLPEGDYRIFVDLTLSDTGLSSTTTASIHLPPVPSGSTPTDNLRVDPDDSWATCTTPSVANAADAVSAYHFEDGLQLLWKPHPTLRARHDAGLQFEVRDAAGQPATLEPYMGMISHAAVMRADGGVFAHLHPAGNFSMAAQSFFESKVAGEASGGATSSGMMDHSRMHHGGATASSAFELPYEFPSAGDYHLWVQFKTAGQVHTARFDVTVAP